MKSSLVESFKRKFGPVPLLQSGHLQIADKIQNPEDLDPEELDRLRQMGHTFIQSDANYIAVAYTEFPPIAFEFFGTNPRFRNIIYLSHLNNDLETTPSVDFIPLSGSILINPEVRVPVRVKNFINDEGCGSIGNGKITMFIERPTVVFLNAHIYNPDLGYETPTYVSEIDNIYQASAFALHEFTHLKGQDATNAPGVELLDPWKNFSAPAWKGNSQEEWISLARESHDITGKNYLVIRDNQLLIVGPNGNPLRKFR